MYQASKKSALFILLVAAVTISCKETSSNDLKYLLMGPPGLTMHYDKPKITLCTNDLSQANDIKRAAASWFAAINAAPNIVVEGGSNCDADIIYDSAMQGASNTSVSDIGVLITMNATDQWFKSYAVLAHEFGHAFGLSDTYDQGSRQSGVCVAGQPREALMCTPNYEIPQKDDIDGVRDVLSAFGPNLKGKDLPNYNDPNFQTSITGNQGGTGTNQQYVGVGRISTLGDLLAQMGNGLSNQVTGNPGTATGAASCDSSVKVMLVRPKTSAVGDASQNSFAVIRSGAARSLSVCLGNTEVCSSPHSTRYPTSVTEMSGRPLYVSTPVTPADLQKLGTNNLTTGNGAKVARITVDGIQTEPEIKAFRCETTLTY